MEFFLKPLAMLERRVPQAVINRDDLFTAIWAKRFLAADLAAVRIVSRSARSTIGRALAIMISKLGNGWIYLILGAITFQCAGREGLPIIALAGLNAALLHCLFPHIKRYIGRQRPFHADPQLPVLLKVLDEHSFPSGHTMTLSGVLVPIVIGDGPSLSKRRPRRRGARDCLGLSPLYLSPRHLVNGHNQPLSGPISIEPFKARSGFIG
jgi:undecaprenyl-diphosphatase